MEKESEEEGIRGLMGVEDSGVFGGGGGEEKDERNEEATGDDGEWPEPPWLES